MASRSISTVSATPARRANCSAWIGSPGTAHAVTGTSGVHKIGVSIVSKLDATGFTSNRQVQEPLRVKGDVPSRRMALELGVTGPGSAVTPLSTFRKIATLEYGGTWATLLNRYTAGKLAGVPLIGREYVRVADAADVSRIAAALRRDGYNPSYLGQPSPDTHLSPTD